MTGPALLSRLRQAGLTVSRDGDHLIVTPGSRLTDELREAIRNGKQDLLAALVTEPENPPADLTARIRAMARKWGFSTQELAEEFSRAAADPAAELLWVEHDEAKFGTGDTPRITH
jgi:hypothetical protein